MTKKQTKIFSIFWFISAMAWLVATIRHLIVFQDTIGVIIFFITFIISLILAFNFHKVNKEID